MSDYNLCYNLGYIPKDDYIIREKQGLEPQTYGNINGCPCSNTIKYPVTQPDVNYSKQFIQIDPVSKKPIIPI